MTRNERTIGIDVGLKETIMLIALPRLQMLPIHFLSFKITVLYGTYAKI